MNVDPQALRALALFYRHRDWPKAAETDRALRDALTEIDRLRKEVDHQRGIAAQLRDMREEDAEQARAEVARLRCAWHDAERTADQLDAARAEVARLRKENAALRAGDDAVSIAGKVALMKARDALGEGA